MENSKIGIIVFLVSMIVSQIAYPILLRYARAHNIVDNPAWRKLQRVPVPVMGGEVVYAGILAGGIVLRLMMDSDMLTYGIIGMTVMMIIGLWDDMRDISVLLRFGIEIALVYMFIAMTGIYIDDFHGLWGIYELDPLVGIPLSVFFGVGIINAVNLIDGVDGYSSGYGMLACMFFGLAFWTVWSPVMVGFTLVVIGALIPFFMHNVFGVHSKMFMGDGGTLMLGTLMTVLVFYAMSSTQRCNVLEDRGVGICAFVLAVMCIPAFDTLRVMTMRMLRGRSPFSPDKTHLHHLFVDMGFSHLGTALFILMINTMVVAVWFVSWKLGASVDMQMYLVMLMGIMVTFGFYKLMKAQQTGGPVDEEGYPQGTRLWHMMCRFGAATCREKNRVWRFLIYLMDGPLVGNLGKKRE